MHARVGVLLALVGCAAGDGGYEPAPPAQPLEAAWQTIRPGDAIVLVPGTGSVEYLAIPIEAMGETHPRVDVWENEIVRSDAVVFEQAIAAAKRAGISDAELEAGAVSFLLWGTGITKLTAFDYVSYEGLTIRMEILGGESSCARGEIRDNYFNYTKTSADLDARDLYVRLGSWLDAHPSATPRNIAVVSHSWGGAVAEYLALELDAIRDDLGALPGGAHLPFTVAAGVPSFILGYSFLGARVVDIDRPWGKRLIYGIVRPDDPVPGLSFEGDYGGHHYNIVWGDDFRGVYGISTDELSCHQIPGPCGGS